MTHDWRHEEEAQPVILRVSEDYPELKNAADWLGERRIRCTISEQVNYGAAAALRLSPQDSMFLLEVCDPSDYDIACGLLDAFDAESEADTETEHALAAVSDPARETSASRSPWIAVAVVAVIIGSMLLIAF